MCVVALGTPFDGLTIYGPFDNTNEALEWAKKVGGNWEIVLLNDPNT